MVRTALNLEIDRDALVKGALVGYGQPAHPFVPPEYSQFYNPAAVSTYDVAGAEAMLEQAGWVKSKVGIRAKGEQRGPRSP